MNLIHEVGNVGKDHPIDSLHNHQLLPPQDEMNALIGSMVSQKGEQPLTEEERQYVIEKIIEKKNNEIKSTWTEEEK